MKAVIAIRFEAEVLNLLRGMAVARDVSVSALVNQAVGAWLETRPETQAPPNTQS